MLLTTIFLLVGKFEWKRKRVQGGCDRVGRVSVRREVQSELCCGE